jgi:SAM-dependent methyltransferase
MIECAVCGSANHERLLVARGNRGQPYISLEHPVAICTECGLVYLNPQHEDADYDRYYRTADYRPITLAPERFLRQSRYRRVQAAYLWDTLTRVWPGRRPQEISVLDVGCGPGALLAFLRERGLDVAGLEASPVAAAYARDALGLVVTDGSVNDADLPGRYDVAVSTASIEHFTDPMRAVDRMQRMLKPGGLLYVNTPDLLGCVLKKGTGNCFKFVHTYYFTEKSLGNLLRKAGLEIVRSWPMAPILKADVLHPGNYCSGELNIIALKPAQPRAAPEPERESPDQIRTAYATAQRRDRLHARFRAAYQHRAIGLARRVLARVWKPQPVFSEFFLSEHEVDVRRFPPLLHP